MIHLKPEIPVAARGSRDYATVKVDRDLLIKAKTIAGRRRITVADYFSELLRPHVDKDWAKEIRQMQKEEQEGREE
jgi:hypothetical protein